MHKHLCSQEVSTLKGKVGRRKAYRRSNRWLGASSRLGSRELEVLVGNEPPLQSSSHGLRQTLRNQRAVRHPLPLLRDWAFPLL